MSPHATYASLLIDQHYEGLGLDQGWDSARVNRLCRLMEVTPYELGRLCCIPYVLMNRMLKKNYFPPWIALQFAMLESFYVGKVCGAEQAPVMPVNLLYAA